MPSMTVVRRWVDNVEYHEYSPTNVPYDPKEDVFTVARADVHAPDRRHHVTLAVVVSIREMSAEGLSLDGAIRQARAVLELLIEPHRSVAGPPTSDRALFFDIRGRHIR
jgi:hypothetical protein